jgi:hypothetical protein
MFSVDGRSHLAQHGKLRRRVLSLVSETAGGRLIEHLSLQAEDGWIEHALRALRN